MPGEEINTTLRFNADITDFKAAMQEATRSTKLANSEFKAVAAGMDNWSSSTDGLRAKLSQLSTVQQAEERKLAVLQAAYDKVAAEQGEASAAAVDLKTQINNQQAVVNRTVADYQKFTQKLEDVESGADGASDEIKKAGDAAEQAGKDAEDSGGGWTILKDVIADLVSNAISGLIDSISNAAEETREYRRDMAQLAQNASDAGVNMDTMKDKLADVAAVTGETDAAMEGLNMLMASGLDTDQIAFAADALSGAATKFDGVKFEGIAEGLQETLAVGAAVGPFAEVIERSGGNLEEFNAGMEKCTTQAEKQQYVMQWLADSGLKGVNDAYVANNADLVEAEKAQFRYNEAMAGVGAVLEPVQTAFTNIAASIMEKVAPALENIITWLTDNMSVVAPIVIGIATAFGVLATALAIQSIISGVTKAMTLLNATMLANPFVLIAALVAGLVAAFVTLWNKSEAFRNFFLGMWDAIKNGVSTATKWVSDNFAALVKWFTELPGKISSAISGAIDKVTTWGKNLYNAAKKKVSETISGVVTWFKELPGKIASAISGAIDSVITWGKNLATQGVTAAKNLVSSIVDGVTSLPGKMLTVGVNLVSGLWQGLSNSLTWIKEKISSWVGDVLDFIMGLFGINSPSKETEWQGEMLVAGYVKALKAGKSDMTRAMQELGEAGLAAPGITSAGGAVGGGKTINLYQTNNSPRALSRREIYRQTHNALAYAGGV